MTIPSEPIPTKPLRLNPIPDDSRDLVQKTKNVVVVGERPRSSFTDSLQWSSSIFIGGGGNRDKQGGFRGSILPIELRGSIHNWANIKLSLELRLGNGPVGNYAGGGRASLEFPLVSLNFRSGVHASGRPYVGGEIDLPGGLIRPTSYELPEGLFYYLPTLIIGYERVLGADQITRRVEEQIYAGFQWVIPWGVIVPTKSTTP